MGTIEYKISPMRAIMLVDLLVGQKFKLNGKDAVVTCADVYPDSTIVHIREEGGERHKIIFITGVKAEGDE